jgi:hypothetical protein
VQTFTGTWRHKSMAGNRQAYIRQKAIKAGRLSSCALYVLAAFGGAIARAQDSFVLRSTMDTAATTGATGIGGSDGSLSTTGAAPADPIAGADPEAAGSSVTESAADAATKPIDLLQTTGSIEPAPEQRAAKVAPENTRVQSAGDAPPRDEDPFAPLGIRVGSFIIRPSLEQGVRATDNVSMSPDGKSSVLSETTLRLNAVSDWSRHFASFNGYLTAVKSFAGEKYSEPLAGFDGRLRLDLTDDVAVNADAGYSLSRQTGSDPTGVGGTSIPPLQQNFFMALGATRSASKFIYNLTGRLDRWAYGNAELAGGGTVSQKDRDNTLLTATLRTGYEISPAAVPFVAAELGTRLYDDSLDTNGYDRSSIKTGFRAGTAFDFGEKLNGEFALGWVSETFDDPRLADITGPVALANVNWSPRRLTTVSLNATTTTEASTEPGQSGSLLYAANAIATRQIRADLSASATLGGYYRDYVGSVEHDIGYTLGMGFTYWLTHSLGLVGRLSREQMYSNVPERPFAANNAYLGLRFQR